MRKQCYGDMLITSVDTLQLGLTRKWDSKGYWPWSLWGLRKMIVSARQNWDLRKTFRPSVRDPFRCSNHNI
jgi:hypothetical protein